MEISKLFREFLDFLETPVPAPLTIDINDMRGFLSFEFNFKSSTGLLLEPQEFQLVINKQNKVDLPIKNIQINFNGGNSFAITNNHQSCSVLNICEESDGFNFAPISIFNDFSKIVYQGTFIPQQNTVYTVNNISAVLDTPHPLLFSFNFKKKIDYIPVWMTKDEKFAELNTNNPLEIMY